MTTDSTPQRPYVTPAVRALASTLGVPLADLEGSGTGVAGRVRLDDVRAAHNRRLSAQAAFRPAWPTPDDGWFPGVPLPRIDG